MELSEKTCRIVKKYLLANYGIDDTRMKPTEKAPHNSADNSNPTGKQRTGGWSF